MESNDNNNTNLLEKIRHYLDTINSIESASLSEKDKTIFAISFLKGIWGEDFNEGLILTLLPKMRKFLFDGGLLKVGYVSESNNGQRVCIDSEDGQSFVCLPSGGLLTNNSNSDRIVFDGNVYTHLHYNESADRKRAIVKTYDENGLVTFTSDEIFFSRRIDSKRNIYTPGDRREVSVDYDNLVITEKSYDVMSDMGLSMSYYIPGKVDSRPFSYRVGIGRLYDRNRGAITPEAIEKDLAYLPNLKAKFDQVFGKEAYYGLDAPTR